MRRLISSLSLLALLSGPALSSMASDPDSVTHDGMKFCISYYRDGYYNRVIECIKDVQASLSTRQDSILSYKYLAISYGMINQIEKAQECFSLALEKDPSMEIDTLAFPPNIALIYKQVKLERKLAQIDTTAGKETAVVPREKRNTTFPALMLASAVLSAGGAGFLYYKGYSSRQEYSSIESKDQSRLNRTWDTFLYSTAGGVACTLLCGVATYFFINADNGASLARLSAENGGVALTFSF
ncbi:MAG: hypothetical protein JXA71_06950 [Chitinispirillaceae bacterium]|nr:hypothetical protein [Chitinispirillaceae bacterium]